MTKPLQTAPASGVSPQRIFPHWPLAEMDGAPPPQAAWVRAEPFAFAGSWEPPTFRRRSGYAWTDEDDYAEHEEYSDAALARMREMGCNHIVLPFAKGCGRAAVSEEIGRLREIIGRAKKTGLRVGTYIQVAMVVPELLVGEYPDVGSFLARDELGRTHAYHPQQPSRHVLCHTHPGSVGYLEDQIRFAIEELGADLLHLDGFQAAGLPWQGCRCARCTDSYRQWLKARYPDEKQRRREFGPVDFDRITPPRFDANTPISTIVISPDWHAYFRFQWDRQLALLKHLRRFARGLNGEVAMSINPLLSNARNQHLFWGQWAERLLPWVDAAWCEDPFHLRYENGRVISRASVFKLAQEHGTAVCCYHWFPDEPRIGASVAFTTALNGGNAVCLGFTHRFLPHYSLGGAAKRRIVSWTKEHWHLFQGAKPTGEIALLRHQPSLAWNSSRPWGALLAVEQVLTQLKVPWRMIDDLGRLSDGRIKTLIAPDAECLSDTELAALRAWVGAGGRLIATPFTATHDENRSRRPQNPLREWSGKKSSAPRAAEWHAWLQEDYIEVEDAPEAQADGGAEVVSIGKGTLALVRITPAVPVKDAVNAPLSADALQLPRNAGQITTLLRRVHGAMEIEARGGAGLVLHATRTAGAKLIHIVQTDPHAAAQEVTIAVRDGLDRANVTVHSPDAALPGVSVSGGEIRLRGLRQYAVVRLEKKTAS